MRRKIEAKELGRTLAILRVAKGMSLEDVKRETGLFVDQITEIENGENTSGDSVNRILELYGLSLFDTASVKEKETECCGNTEKLPFFKGLFNRIFGTKNRDIPEESVEEEEDYEEYNSGNTVDDTDNQPYLPNMGLDEEDTDILHNFRTIITNGYVVPNKKRLENRESYEKLKRLDINNHEWSFWTDGGSIQDGRGAWGFLLICDGQPVIQRTGYNNKQMTSTVCEYMAVMNALAEAVQLGIKNVLIFSDLKPLVHILNSETYVVKSSTDSRLVEMIETIRENRSMFKSLEIRWIKAHDSNRWNTMIDNAVTEELKKHNVIRR